VRVTDEGRTEYKTAREMGVGAKDELILRQGHGACRKPRGARYDGERLMEYFIGRKPGRERCFKEILTGMTVL